MPLNTCFKPHVFDPLSSAGLIKVPFLPKKSGMYQIKHFHSHFIKVLRVIQRELYDSRLLLVLLISGTSFTDRL